MRPDRVSNPGPLTYESGALPTALRGLAIALDMIINVIFLLSIPTIFQSYQTDRRMIIKVNTIRPSFSRTGT